MVLERLRKGSFDAVTPPAHLIHDKRGEKVDQDSTHIVQVMEEQRVPQRRSGAEKRARAKTPGSAEDPPLSAGPHDVRHLGNQQEDPQEVRHPAEVQPVEVLLGRGPYHLHPADGEQDEDLEDVDDPEVPRKGAEAPGDEE